MTYIRHYLLSWGGTLGNGAEVWANNIRLMPPIGGTWGAFGDIEEGLSDVVTDIKTHMANPDARYGSQVRLEWVKLNEIDEFGRYADTAKSHTRFLTGLDQVTGGAGSSPYPWSTSLAVTFGTNATRGRGSKGRVFVPCPAGMGNIGADGLWDRDQTPTAAAWATFITNLRNWPGMDFPNSPVPGIVSAVGTPGPANEITSVRVGRRPDVQRRRTNNLDEVYVTARVT